MPSIKRKDGMQFAVRTYRELLTETKTNVLKTQIRELSTHHGEHVRFFKKSGGQLEVVFSRDPGFLLAETVWHHFNKPENLIYCEVIPDERRAILIIFRENSAFIDAKIPIANITDELSAMVEADKSYAIYLHGDVPISDTQEHGKFTFKPEQINVLKHLSKPLINELPANESLQLQPLEFALKTQRIGKRSPVPLVLTGVLLAVATWGFFAFQSSKTNKPVAVHHKAKVNLYKNYDHALKSPAPSIQLSELATRVKEFYTVPGWELIKVNYRNGYRFTLKQTTGDLHLLQYWVSQHRLQYSSHSSTNAEVTISSTVPNRQSPPPIADLQKTLITLIDNINQLFTYNAVKLAPIQTRSYVKKSKLVIHFTNASPTVLELLSRTFLNQPSVLIAVDMNVHQGLLSGNIELTVLGK